MKTRSARYKASSPAQVDFGKDVCYVRRKEFTISIIIMVSVICLLGFATGKPEIIYLSTIAFIISISTIFCNNVALNSMAVAFVPVFIVVITYNIYSKDVLNLIYHGLTGAILIFIAAVRWRNSSSLFIVFFVMLYVAYAFALTAIPEIQEAYKDVLNPTLVFIGVTSTFLLAFGIHLAKSRA